MNNESNLVLEIWELVRDQLPAARRVDIASGVLRAFVEFGMEQGDLGDLVDEDPYLARAFYEVFEDEIEEADDFSDEE